MWQRLKRTHLNVPECSFGNVLMLSSEAEENNSGSFLGDAETEHGQKRLLECLWLASETPSHHSEKNSPDHSLGKQKN